MVAAAILTQKAQALLNSLWVPFVLTEALLKGDRVEIEVKRNPGKTEWTLRSNLSEQPLTSAANNVTLTVRCAKCITDRSRENRRKKVSLRFYGGRYFSLVLRQELVRRITHTLSRSPVQVYFAINLG
jgi:hypothetical protein